MGYKGKRDSECLEFPIEALSFEQIHSFHKNKFPIIAGFRGHMCGVSKVYYGNDAGCKTENVLVFDPYDPENSKVMLFANFLKSAISIQVGMMEARAQPKSPRRSSSRTAKVLSKMIKGASAKTSSRHHPSSKPRISKHVKSETSSFQALEICESKHSKHLASGSQSAKRRPR